MESSVGVRRGHPLVRAQAWRIGLLALGLGIVLMGGAALRNHHRLFLDDATLYRIVARNPFANGSALRPGAKVYGVAYRYGRVGYPLAAWLLAFGQARFVGWTMGIVSLISYAVSAALAAELLARHGRRPLTGLIVLAAPVMTISMGILFAEPTVIALILLTYLLWVDGRHGAALIVGAAIPLVREVAAIALIPLVIDSVRRRSRGEVLGFALSAAPYAAWATIVRVRMGEWPFLDHSTSGRGGLGVPLSGYFKVLNPPLTVFAGLTLLLAVWLHRSRPWWPVTLGALLFALMIPFLGKDVLRYSGDSFRVMGPAHALLLIGAVGAFGAKTEETA